MLMPTAKLLRARLATFAQDARGSLSVEAALILPLLCWFYVASFVWFDAFRTQNANLKASYTLADMLSRANIEHDRRNLLAVNLLRAVNHGKIVRSGFPRVEPKLCQPRRICCLGVGSESGLCPGGN